MGRVSIIVHAFMHRRFRQNTFFIIFEHEYSYLWKFQTISFNLNTLTLYTAKLVRRLPFFLYFGT